MRRNSYTLTEYHTFAASTTTQVDLPESGYITQIDCLLHLNVTGDTAVTPKCTETQDELARIIDSSNIKASRARSYFDISDGRQWKWWNHFNYEGELQMDTLPSAGDTEDIYGLFRYHVGFDPTNPFDPTVPIPGCKLSNLQHNMTWGAATDFGTGYTINSGDMKLTISEITLDEGELESDLWPEGLVDPRVEARVLDIDATYSNLSMEDDVPVGDTLYQTVVMVVDSSDCRTDTNVSAVGVKFPKKRETPWDINWQPLKAKTRSLYRVPASVVGATMIPWEELSGRAVGLDLGAAQVGDARLCFTTTTNSGDIHLLYFAYS